MIRTAMRPSLGIKPGWVGVPRPKLRWIASSTLRRIRREISERKAMNEAFKSRRSGRSFLIPVAAALTAQGANHSHDLLFAVGELAYLEQRTGCTFKDKLLGISALKISAAPVIFKTMDVPLEVWRRLALLGDRVLYLALCEVWFESGRSRCTYHCQDYMLKFTRN